MITYEDCLALADLAPEAVDRVAAREGLTAIAALGLASRLATAAVGGRGGERRIADAAVPGAVAARAAAIPARMRAAPAGPGTERLAA
jgi:hypothetical protein